MMSHLKMDFTNEEELVAGAASNATTFSLTCKNNSATSWVFYVYQTMPDQMYDTFSLAWFASPYRINPGNMITFTWALDTSFVWGNTGMLMPGVTFMASGIMPCSATGANTTTFSLNNNIPQLSVPVSGGQQGSLTVNTAANVPMRVFSTGIGMSGQATFVQQAMPNMRQVYNASAPQYWVAVAGQMQIGTVLPDFSNTAARVDFGGGATRLTATLNANNTWTISQ